MKALLIIGLCMFGGGVCACDMRKAYETASGAVDKAFEKPLEWTHKKWPGVFDSIMASIDGRDSETRRHVQR